MDTKREEEINTIVNILDKHKAENIKIFNDLHHNYAASVVIICNSTGAKHNEALSKYIKDEPSLKQNILIIEDGESWSVVDLGDIFVHIMTKSARELYKLEDMFNGNKIS